MALGLKAKSNNSVAQLGTSLCLVGLLSFAGGISAGPEPADGATQNARVGFSVSIFALFRKSGTFERVETRFKQSAGSIKVDARIATNSVVMRSKSDAALLMSASYFDAKRYATIHFISDDIPFEILHAGGTVQGNLSLRGKTQRQQFFLHASPCAKRWLENASSIQAPCVIKMEGSLQRSNFGMIARRGVVSDTVELSLDVPLVKAIAAKDIDP